MSLLKYGLGIGRIAKATVFGKSTKLSASLVLPAAKTCARNVTLDPVHVAAYNNISESWANNEYGGVHFMYPAMMTAPLQFEVMSSESFPFPLLGLVHLSNRIQQFGHISLDTKCRIEVYLEDKLTLHEKGYIANMVCDVYCEESNKLLWKSTGGLFHFNKKAAGEQGSHKFYESEIKQDDINDAEEIEVWQHDASKGRKYASVSKDYNPIHLSAISASLFGFKKGAIMHGMWTKARSVTALMPPTSSLCIPTASGQPMAEMFVEFKTPLYLPSTTVLRAKESMNGNRKDIIFDVSGRDDENLPHVRGKCHFYTK
jgi:acyl dehydratase